LRKKLEVDADNPQLLKSVRGAGYILVAPVTGPRRGMKPRRPPPARLLHGLDETDVFRSLFAAYPDALIVADAAGRVVLANPSAAALFGYAVDELVGLEIEQLVPDHVRPQHAAYRAAFAREPRARPMGKQTELVARRKDGSEVVVEIALSPLQDHGLPLVVAAIRDIGAYPRMKQALQRAHYSEHLAQLGRLAVDTRDPRCCSITCPCAQRPRSTSTWPSSTCSRKTSASCASPAWWAP
jgi:PAS domain S-box-containing protein